MSTDTKLKPATFRHIEAELYAYSNSKKEIKNIREQIMNSSDRASCFPGRNSARVPSRTTEMIATRLTTDKRLRNLEEIVDAIELTYEELPHTHKKIIELKYWSYNRNTWEAIADMCYIHRNTVRKYRDEIIALIAAKVGWK